MSSPFGEFKDYVESRDFDKLVLLDYEDDFDVIQVIKMLPNQHLNRKDLRLAIDLINDIYPLYKHMDMESRRDFIEEIFQTTIPIERLRRLNPWKRIIYRSVIGLDNNNHIITRRVKK
jgi:hypothetical protein